jgi:hypothetical protein
VLFSVAAITERNSSSRMGRISIVLSSFSIRTILPFSVLLWKDDIFVHKD